MQVGIDCRFAGTNSGLGRYTRELVTCLLKRNDPWKYVLFVRSREETWLKSLPHSPTLIPAPFKHYSFDEQRHMPKLIRVSGVHVFFSPHFNVPFFCPVPFVATVHDLILHRFPNQAPLAKRMIYKLLMSRTLRKAEHVITVSQFVADDITTTYGERVGEKLVVISEGVDDSYKPVDDVDAKKIHRTHGIEKPYLLYVGNAKQHKNVQLLLDAFSTLKRGDLSLVLVANGPEVKSLNLPPRVKVVSQVQDSELPALYTAAECFVTASLYEGYGLPVAEALACGCPVIASDCGAVNEIAKGHATLVEPTTEAFAAAMEHLPKAHSPLRLGSWAKAAEQTAGVFMELRSKPAHFR